MAGENHQITMNALEAKLRPLVAALDDSALEALASKGLLRRAQKDLERSLPQRIRPEDVSAVCFKVDQFEVTIPEAGPAKAKCSCPAAGVCQHILTAVLFLKREAPAKEILEAVPDAVASVEKEILAFTPEQIEKWSGKAVFRAALEYASRYAVEIGSERGLVIRFPSVNTQCHYAPGGGLDGIIVSGNVKDERRVAAAAVIAFQKSRGVAWEDSTNAAIALEESAGAPRSRSEVLDVAQAVLYEMLDNGLSRVSTAIPQRLTTLAVSATGVNLPRLSLALRGLSDECTLVTARDARSDLGRMLGRMAQLHALCSAIQRGGTTPRPDLVGWHRTQYDEIGNVDLIGVAAWPWRTASGYSGLTVLFWDANAKQWNSWTDARPLNQQRDFHEVARYTQPGPWEGAESPRQLARSSFRLMNGRRNSNGRLSASSKSRVLVTGPANLAEQALPVIEDWLQLLRPLESQISVGLGDVNPLGSIFILRPAVWEERHFDPVKQIFRWRLLDSQEQPMTLEMAYDGLTEPAIRYLERATPQAVKGALVVGRVQRIPEGLLLLPHTIHPAKGDCINLLLDTAKADAKSKLRTTEAGVDEEMEDEETPESLSIFIPGINEVLDEIDETLLVVAEAGIAGLNPLRIERLRQITPRAERLGLQALSAGLEKVVSQPQALGVLRCLYVNQLHRQAMHKVAG